MTDLYEPALEACNHCPSPDRCTREGTCRATWDSHTRERTFNAERAAAEQYPCPDCHADPGSTCLNLHTGEQLVKQPAHLARIRAHQPALTQEATP